MYRYQRVRRIGEANLIERIRVVMEKPCGVDLESAIKLNREVHKVFDEGQVFRIDHFLGKEPAQDILAFRFANGLFEPIWNRNFIEHVQIHVSETLGLDKRAAFYENTGSFRDMVVTHLLHIPALVVMEPPVALEPNSIREGKNTVFRIMTPTEPHHAMRGQYTGYTSTEASTRTQTRKHSLPLSALLTIDAGQACHCTFVRANDLSRVNG
jgi:glucose-6-phosphate 1-dehydrogenase